MILSILGGCLIGGGVKGFLEKHMKQPRRPIREHTPVYSRQ